MAAELNMLEGMVLLATCDKVVPGMVMGALRVNIPAVMLTGGYMARQAGNVIAQAVKQEIKPREFITKESFENVVSYMMATGGATNSLLHIPAIANQMGIEMLPEECSAPSKRKLPWANTAHRM